MTRMRNRSIAIQCKIKTIKNSQLIKLIKNQSKHNYIVNDFRIVSMKTILQKLIMKKTIIESIDFFQSNSHNEFFHKL